MSKSMPDLNQPEQKHGTAPMLDSWQEHKARLRNFIAKRVREHGAIEDILQDVFLKAHLGFHTVRSPGSITAWLYRIAVNRITDHYREQRPSDEISDELATPEPEPDYVGELASCLPPMIADLPEAYRIPLVLSEIDGLTQKEVAAQLGLSVSGAKSRVQRGRAKLRQRLLECCEIETGNGGVVGYEIRNKQQACVCA